MREGTGRAAQILMNHAPPLRLHDANTRLTGRPGEAAGCWKAEEEVKAWITDFPSLLLSFPQTVFILHTYLQTCQFMGYWIW